MQQPFQVSSLTLTYNTPEDRLVLLVVGTQGERLGLLITRRLTARLVNGLAGILENSSMTVSRAPADMRGDVVLLEHQKAMGGDVLPELSGGMVAGQSESSSQAGQTVQVQTALLTAVDVAPKPTDFEISLKSGDQMIAGFNTTRSELHRILGLLKSKALEADWDLNLEASWLGPDQSLMVIN